MRTIPYNRPVDSGPQRDVLRCDLVGWASAATGDAEKHIPALAVGSGDMDASGTGLRGVFGVNPHDRDASEPAVSCA